MCNLPYRSLSLTHEKNGGIDTPRFLDWGYLFVEHVEPLKREGRKLLLIYDGYRALLYLAVLDLFHKNNIIVYVLTFHTSGKTHPLDVILFSVFQKCLQDPVTSCAPPGGEWQYDLFGFCALIRDAYYRAFTVHNVQASFRRSGIWPFDPTKLLSTPRPITSHENSVIMTAEELFVAFEEKQEEMQDTVLGSDSRITRSGFIDTTKGAVVTSTKALELARRKHDDDRIRHRETAARDERKMTKLKRKAFIAAKGACEYYSARMRRCTALAGKGEEEFLGSVRSLRERCAVTRMRNIFRKQVFSVQ